MKKRLFAILLGAIPLLVVGCSKSGTSHETSSEESSSFSSYSEQQSSTSSSETSEEIISSSDSQELPPLDKSLKEIYQDYFSIGAAINDTTMTSDLISEFNSFTAENAMKWMNIHPTLEDYTYLDADAYIETAKELGAKVRGHALVWHDALPYYVFNNDGNSSEDTTRTKEEVLQIEADHIRNVVTHFGDDVYCWDVCNEVIDDNPTSELKPDGSNIYRDSDWYRLCGKDYIKVAFETADKTLKELGIRDKVKLFYNDYGNTKAVKREKTIAMLNWLISENVPIDGIGLQSHYHLGSFNMQEFEESIIAYSELGLDVQITEFDVEIYDIETEEFENQDFRTYASIPEQNLNMQATIYDRALEICRRHSDVISNVTFWGVTDSSCYMNSPMPGNPNFGFHTNYPFLFDRLNRKKPCYYAIAEFGEYLNHTYNPYAESTAVNVYDNSGQDMHLTRFASDNMQIVSRPVLQEDSSYKVTYNNVSGYNYVGTGVSGRMADFAYINVLAKGTPGKTIALRIFHSGIELENHNLLGNDVSFSLENDFTIHTLRIKSDYRSRLDLATRVCIYPEIGVADAYGEFYYKDVWFSDDIPENAVLENPGVDSGDTSKSVNGWVYESWTGYTLYNDIKGTGVSYVEAKEYASISKEIEIKDEHDNALEFSFENIIEFDKQTISHIRFILRGDVIGQGVSPEGYDYDIFIEDHIYTYNIADPEHVLPDENNITTLQIPLANAINTIGNKHENGYHLTIMIESFADDRALWDMSRDGQMIITDCHVYDGSYVKDLYTQTEDSEGFQYNISEKEGVERNITYTDLRGDKYWPVIYRSVESTHDEEIVIAIRNNGDSAVRIGVHAGILYDERADEHNHFFYPLYNANKGEKNPDGYYTDGDVQDIEAMETYTFVVSVDEDEMYANDAISTLEFLIDNLYGDTVLRSGDVDIVSVTVQAKGTQEQE